MQAHSCKGAGYCYMTGRELNSCLLGHVTGLNFCLYVKLLLSSTLNSVDIWSSMSCIVPDIELADKNINKELSVFIDGEVQGYTFCPPKKYNSTKQAFWYTRNMHGNVWNSVCLDYNENPLSLLGLWKVNNSQKEQHSRQFIGLSGGKLGWSWLL